MKVFLDEEIDQRLSQPITFMVPHNEFQGKLAGDVSPILGENVTLAPKNPYQFPGVVHAS